MTSYLYLVSTAAIPVVHDVSIPTYSPAYIYKCFILSSRSTRTGEIYDYISYDQFLRIDAMRTPNLVMST